MKLFLDTNVLIDFIMERRPFYSAAATLVSLAAECKIELCVSALSMTTSNYICVERCKMPVEMYRRKIDFLRKFVSVVSIDASDIFNSYDRHWHDFEDGVQYFSAKRCNTDYIITRNGNDFEEHDIKVISSEDACRML